MAPVGLQGDAVGIAGSDAGYLVAQWDREIVFSANLSAWTPVDLPLDDPELGPGPRPVRIYDVQAGLLGGEFLVVGSYSHEPCDSNASGDGGPPPCDVSPVSWVSSDGRTWRASDRAELPVVETDLGPYVEFVATWPVADGWDAAVGASAGIGPEGNVVVHSADGRTWTRLAAPPVRRADAAPGDVFTHAGAALPEGGRLLWQVWQHGEEAPETTLASSVDGHTWEPLASLGMGSEVVGAVGPYYFKDGWLLAGQIVDLQAGSTPTVWTSMDLRQWIAVSLPMPEGAWTASITDVDDFGTGYIAVGTWRDDTGLEWGATWLSANGADWFLMPWASEAVPTDAPVFMSNGRAGLAAVGFDTNDIADIAAWLVVR